MHSILLSAGSVVDAGFVRGVITALTMAVFLGICWWAYTSHNRERFEEDALLPFDEHERPRTAVRAAERESR